MLVLTRKVGQEVVIGTNVRVVVVGIRHGKARLGFTAPVEVPIHREEVYKRIQRGESRGSPTNLAESGRPSKEAAAS